MRLNDITEKRFTSDPSGDCYWWQGSWYSNAYLQSLSESCLELLKNSGFSQGHRLAVLLPNSPMLIALSIGCWKLGGAVAPINPKAGIQGLERTISMLDVHAVIIPSSLEEIKEPLSKLGVPFITSSLDALCEPFTGRGGIPESADHAVIFSTSGTTGLPKAVITTHGNIIDNTAQDMTRLTSLVKGDIFLNALPAFHTLGYNVCSMLPLLHDMKMAMLPSFVPTDAAINAIIEAKVDVIVAVPTMVSLLIGALSKSGKKIHELKLLVCGGDRLNIMMDERAKAVIGVPIIEGYGLTECSPVVALAGTYESRKLGAVGPLLDSYEMMLRDNDGNELPKDAKEGVLWVKGPSVVPGYFRDAATTAERFVGGFFNTGDVVRIDEDGYIAILDRITDIIIVGGFNVYPQEVERVLSEHPAVQLSAVVGEKQSMTGEIVKAYIIPKKDMTIDTREIIAFCKERLAHFKVPRKIIMVEELPISNTGKILRRELKNRKD